MTSAPALWTKHQTVARAIARDYIFPGADRQDVTQEALIALWEAARTFDPERGPFPAYARTVIHRHLQDCLSTSRRLKHHILTGSVRVIDTRDGEMCTVTELTADPLTTEQHVVAADRLRGLVGALAGLTRLERLALARHLNGDGCYERKALDNALQRARAKLKAAA